MRCGQVEVPPVACSDKALKQMVETMRAYDVYMGCNVLT